MRLRIPLLVAASVIACRTTPASHAENATPPTIIPHAHWEARPPLGYAADANRRNVRAGDSLVFRTLRIDVVATQTDSTRTPPVDAVRLRLSDAGMSMEQTVVEGAAVNWRDYHLAIVAIYGPGELGAGLVAIEVATRASLPERIATSATAGGADMRLRIPHRITHVTLHHTGSPQPLLPHENPVDKLRGLQSWGAAGRIYQGRDHRYMGETNTTYDPAGHFLISMIGNYDRQEPSLKQLGAIADLMAWAIRTNGVSLDRIGGHYHYADTGCPGRHLRKYLEDGTLRRMVAERLGSR